MKCTGVATLAMVAAFTAVAPNGLADAVTINAENVRVVKGAEGVEPFDELLLVRGDDELEFTPGALITIDAPETAAVDVLAETKDREPVEVFEDARRYLITTPGEIYVDVLVVTVVNGIPDIERRRQVINVGGDNGGPGPPPAGDFSELEKKSKELSLALNTPKRRKELSLRLVPQPFPDSMQAGIDRVWKNYKDIMAPPIAGEARADWADGWWAPLNKELGVLLKNDTIETVEDYEQAWLAIQKGCE